MVDSSEIACCVSGKLLGWNSPRTCSFHRRNSDHYQGCLTDNQQE
ncbi:unnamed protein product [Schistosoma curassoni]|uniref:Uncharacterized protein n=1 Tax=Schistosoma curassoni TaxID=6186 RepID=A0A183KI85_9TREM|nr:unnamed protein product [Schistosoma curassoni]